MQGLPDVPYAQGPTTELSDEDLQRNLTVVAAKIASLQAVSLRTLPLCPRVRATLVKRDLVFVLLSTEKPNAARFTRWRGRCVMRSSSALNSGL